MKKILGLLLVMMMLVSPLTARALSADDEEIDIKKYNTLGLKETLAQESIKEEFKDYKETDDQVIIYLFRGNGCGYCRNFLTFLNGITDEYGKYFKLVSFEVWNDQANSELLQKVGSFLEQDAGGVPYIVIGDQVFPGFADSYADSIKTTIKELYDSKDRYDVFEAYNEAIAEAKSEEYARTVRPIVFNAIFVAIGTCVVCYYVRKQNQELVEKLSSQKNANRVVKEETEKEYKKPVNKKRK